MNKDVEKLGRKLENNGWKVVRGKRSNHLKIYPPQGGGRVVLSCTPSDGRTIKNTMSQLRRLGYDG